MKNLLTYLVAFAIPVVLVIVGACCKKIMEKRPFQVSDWFLGMDLLLAAFAAGSINAFDSINKWVDGGFHDPHVLVIVLVSTSCYTLGSFILLIFYIALHQDYVSGKDPDLLSVRICGFGTTAIGAAVIYAFAVLKVKGAL